MHQNPMMMAITKIPRQNSHSLHSNREIRPGMMIPQVESNPHRSLHSRQ